MNDATLITGDAQPAVRLVRHLLDPPTVVWQAITDREQLRSWFPCDVLVAGGQWVVGAAIRFVFPPEVIELTLTGEVLLVDEPNQLVFRWGDEILRFELSPQDTGTQFVLIDELPGSIAARNAAGWEQCLDNLTGHTDPTASWQERFDVYANAFAEVLGPQEGPPAGYKGT